MTNLEMNLLCAEAMGYKSVRAGSDRGPNKEPFDTVWVSTDECHDHSIYDAVGGLMPSLACMALIQTFHLMLTPVQQSPGILWTVCRYNGDWHGEHVLLLRAVAECVAHGRLKVYRDAGTKSRADSRGASAK